MREKGQLEPIDVFPNGLVIDGIGRVKTAKYLQWECIKANVWFDTDWLIPSKNGVYLPPSKSNEPIDYGIFPIPTEEQHRIAKLLCSQLQKYIISRQ